MVKNSALLMTSSSLTITQFHMLTDRPQLTRSTAKRNVFKNFTETTATHYGICSLEICPTLNACLIKRAKNRY